MTRYGDSHKNKIGVLQQVSKEISLGFPSGRPRYNLDDYITERYPYKEEEGGWQRKEIERNRERILSFNKKY